MSYQVANMKSQVLSYAGFTSDRNIATSYDDFGDATKTALEVNGFVVPEVGSVWCDKAGNEYVITNVVCGDVYLDNNRMVTLPKFFHYFKLSA